MSSSPLPEFSFLEEILPELRSLIFSLSDAVTRFVLGFVSRRFHSLYPFGVHGDPPKESFAFAAFLIECLKANRPGLLVRLSLSLFHQHPYYNTKVK